MGSMKIQQIAVACALIAATAGFAGAATVHVAASGTDSATCGTASEPCRSISRGIDHADAGDTVLVGPGHYGSINRDADFTDPGDEAAELSFPGCICVVHVDKPVKVLSRDGASSTTIHGESTNGVSVVRISAFGATFGAKGKGFTVLQNPGLSSSSGIVAESNAGDAVISGNVVSGFGVSGIRSSGDDAVIAHNRLSSNIVGILVDDTATLLGNSVHGGSVGVFLEGSGSTITRNVVYGAASVGIGLDNADLTTITKNAVVANRVGIGVGDQGAPGTTTIKGNTIAGNVSSGLVACTAPCTAVIDARDNFWGAATGPGPDPADGIENIFGATVDASTFATKEIVVTVKPQR